MRLKSLHLAGLMILAAAALHGQTYWSTDPNLACTATGSPVFGPISFPIPGGTGYSCLVEGTFPWIAAGGPWDTTIRVAGPASGAILVVYLFYDTNGNNLNLNYTASGLPPGNGDELGFALNADQASQVDLLGQAATNNSNTVTGSAYAEFFCPDFTTCNNVLPQLLYADFAPGVSWSLSAPISWDGFQSYQWSAVGIDDGVHNIVSFVICNDDITATGADTFTISVYDSNGNLAGSGITKPIYAIPVLPDGSYGEGGTYGDLLRNVVKSPLPSGPFKILIDGGSVASAVEVLQFTSAAATTLQVAYDTEPGASLAGASQPSGRGTRMAAGPRRMPKAMPH